MTDLRAVAFSLMLAACTPSVELESRTFALDGGSDDMPPNEAPVAVDDAVTVDEDAFVEIDVLQNDTDPEGEPLTVYVAESPSDGTVTLEETVVRYQPRPNFNGADSFSYGVLDGFGGSATATVSVTVAPINDPPSFISPTPPHLATLSVVAGETLEVTLAATDVDEDEVGFGFEPFDSDSAPPTIESRALRWTPARADIGTVALRIYADDAMARDERDLTIEVVPPADQMCGQYRCDGDAVCFEETCFPACATSSDCDADKSCFAGRCAVSACDSRSCAQGESCFGGSCFVDCAFDAQCRPGERCWGTRCAATSCADVSCAVDQTCVGGSCRAACETPEECADGSSCFDGGCASDACDGVICPQGQQCAEGSCVPACESDDCACDGGPCAAEEPRFEAGGCGCASAPGLDVAPLALLLVFLGRVVRR